MKLLSFNIRVNSNVALHCLNITLVASESSSADSFVEAARDQSGFHSEEFGVSLIEPLNTSICFDIKVEILRYVRVDVELVTWCTAKAQRLDLVRALEVGLAVAQVETGVRLLLDVELAILEHALELTHVPVGERSHGLFDRSIGRHHTVCRVVTEVVPESTVAHIDL